MEVTEITRSCCASIRSTALALHYKFKPTDEELVEFYLYRKIIGQNIPDGTVLDCDLYGKENPWEIWQRYDGHHREDEDLYFFTRLKRASADGQRVQRRVGLGSWEGENKKHDMRQMAFGANRCRVSIRRFRFEKSGTDQDGRWIMHEYSIDASSVHPRYRDLVKGIVLCRLRSNGRFRDEKIINQGKKRKIAEQAQGVTDEAVEQMIAELSTTLEETSPAQLQDQGMTDEAVEQMIAELLF